jgi:hypothetical protein
MPRLLTAFIDCGVCETTYEGVWADDSIDEQDRAEAPVADQTCPDGHTEPVEYPAWSWRSEAG